MEACLMLDYQTLEQMTDHVARVVQETGSTSVAGTQKTRIKEALNNAYAEVARRYPWPALMDAKETGITATASNKFVYLPKYIQQVYFLLPSTLDQLAPHEAVFAFFNRRGYFKDEGFPIEAFTDAGELGRKADFSSAAELLEISGGTASYTALVHGLTGTDDEVTESVSVTSGAATNTTTSFVDIFSVSTDGNHTSVVTVAGVDSATTYATIGPTERTARYRRLRLSGVPTSAETLAMYYKKRVIPLKNDDQVPEIPVSVALIHKAIAFFYGHQRRWANAMQIHLGIAEQSLQTILGEETMQGHRMEQGVPIHTRSRRHGHTIVVNNGN
jgi:hypothetical protein